MRKKKAVGRFFLYFTAIAVAIIILVPFYILIVNSFKSQKEIVMNILAFPSKLSFDNYVKAFEKLNFMSAAYYSLVVTITSVAALVYFPAMMAWQLVRGKHRASAFVFGSLVFSMLVPFHSIMLPLVQVTDVLKFNGPYTMWVVYLGQGAAMAAFLFHGYVKSVPLEIEESALIEGCNPWQVFHRIVYPLLKPMVVTIAVLEIMWAWNDYLMPKLVLNDTETLPIAIQMFNAGIYGKQIDMMITAVVIMLIPVMIFYIFAQKYIIDGMVAGAIK